MLNELHIENIAVIEKADITIGEQSNMLFSGTSVVTGRAKAIVIAIGLNTEIGKIANSINNTEEEKSPLTIRVEKFSKQISIFHFFPPNYFWVSHEKIYIISCESR